MSCFKKYVSFVSQLSASKSTVLLWECSDVLVFMILQKTPGRLKSFILIIHDVEDCDPKRHDAGKAECRKALLLHRALRLESNQHSQEKNDDGRNERATREGRGAQRGTVRRRVEPREVFCSVSKSFAFECYVTSTSAYLLQQKKLNNRNRISPQSEKYIACKW